MMPTFDELYDAEIGRQLTFAIYAADDLETSLQVRGHPRVWFDLQNLLTAAANLSRLLWPSDSVYGKAVRARLKVDDSPLRSILPRNHFRYFEERMLEWKKNSKNPVFVDANIGPMTNDAGQEIFRNFDPASGEFIFQGEVYQLRKLLDSIRELHRGLGIVGNPSHKDSPS